MSLREVLAVSVMPHHAQHSCLVIQAANVTQQLSCKGFRERASGDETKRPIRPRLTLRILVCSFKVIELSTPIWLDAFRLGKKEVASKGVVHARVDARGDG